MFFWWNHWGPWNFMIWMAPKVTVFFRNHHGVHVSCWLNHSCPLLNSPFLPIPAGASPGTMPTLPRQATNLQFWDLDLDETELGGTLWPVIDLWQPQNGGCQSHGTPKPSNIRVWLSIETYGDLGILHDIYETPNDFQLCLSVLGAPQPFPAPGKGAIHCQRNYAKLGGVVFGPGSLVQALWVRFGPKDGWVRSVEAMHGQIQQSRCQHGLWKAVAMFTKDAKPFSSV